MSAVRIQFPICASRELALQECVPARLSAGLDPGEIAIGLNARRAISCANFHDIHQKNFSAAAITVAPAKDIGIKILPAPGVFADGCVICIPDGDGYVSAQTLFREKFFEKCGPQSALASTF